MILRQFPARTVVRNFETMGGPQMPAEHLRAKPALEADDVIGLHRASDRNCRSACLRHWRGGLPKAGECTMDGDDQFNKLLGSELMMPHITADNARDLMEIALSAAPPLKPR